MDELKVIEILEEKIGFSKSSIQKLKEFKTCLLKYNKRYNLISKNTENSIWFRHILDSAQIINFLKDENVNEIADLGSGAGFPGLVIAIFSENAEFHVKLYEKSPVKRNFLDEVKNKLSLKNLSIHNNVYDEEIIADFVVCRAFKKIGEILKISRENIKKPHKMVILKGKNAQLEINKVSLGKNYSYKMKNSITNDDSKIILVEVK